MLLLICKTLTATHNWLAVFLYNNKGKEKMNKFQKVDFSDKQENQGVQLANQYTKLSNKLEIIKHDPKQVATKEERLLKLDQEIKELKIELYKSSESMTGSHEKEMKIKANILELTAIHTDINENGVKQPLPIYEYKTDRISELGLDLLNQDLSKKNQRQYNIKTSLLDETLLDETIEVSSIQVELSKDNTVTLTGLKLPKLTKADLIKAVLSALAAERVDKPREEEYSILIQHLTELSFRVATDRVLYIKGMKMIPPQFVVNTSAELPLHDDSSIRMQTIMEDNRPPLVVNHSALSPYEKAQIILENDALEKAEIVAKQFKTDNTRVYQY